MDRGLAIVALAGAAGLGYLAWQRWRDGQPPAQRSSCDAAAAIAGELAAIGAPAAAAGASPATVLAAEQNAAQAKTTAAEATRLGCNAWQKLSPTDKVIGALSWPALTLKKGWDGVRWATSQLWGGRDTAEERRRNVAVNGPVVAAVDPRMPRAFFLRHAGAGIFAPLARGSDGRLGLDVPLRHANGCVPYSGHPESARCGAGTYPQDRGPNRYTAAIGTGRADDPASGRHVASLGAFPLTVPAGAVGYWDRGAPEVCAGGLTEDHRAAGSGIVCGQAYTPPLAGSGGATVTDGGAVTIFGDTRGDVPRRQAG